MTISARSPLESPRHAAAGDVLHAVGAARRRLRTVATLRLIAIAAPAGVTAGAALVIAGWAPAATPRVLGVLGAVAAAAWAAARTPPLTAVARMLDAGLGLQDRVAAAVQLQATDGPIAALVARDAAARLAPVKMTSVFPLAMGRLPAVAIALALASMAWLVSGRVGSPAEAPARSASSNSAGAGNASARTRSDARGAATNAAPRTGQAAAPRAVESREQNGRGNATREAFAAAATSRGPQEQPSRTSASGSSVNTADTSRQAAAAPATAGATGRTGRGGTGAGPSASGGITAGAGGASAGNALAATGREPAAPVAAVSFRAARANAEAALARDVIPPDYREHVRAYFHALPSPYTGAGGTR